jgi:hypothetical protein
MMRRFSEFVPEVDASAPDLTWKCDEIEWERKKGT